MTRARDLANLIGSGNFTTETLTATAGQTAFTPSNTFTSNFLQVFYNGLLLDPTVDYTENGTTITLTVAATAGDEMEVVTYNTFSVGDAITQTEADVRYVNAAGDTMSGGLGIGISNPSSYQYNADDLVVGNLIDAGTGITIVSGTASLGSIHFADSPTGDDSYRGFIQYGHAGNYLRFATDAVERMRIDSAGRVTMPYQPAFRAELNQNASFTTAYQIAPFGTVVFNRGGHYNPSTKGFTAPVGGVYSFTIRVRLFSVSNYFYGWFRVNGVDVDYYHTAQNVGDYQSFEATSVLNLNANDVVQVTIRANSNVGYADAGAASQFSGYLLG